MTTNGARRHDSILQRYMTTRAWPRMCGYAQIATLPQATMIDALQALLCRDPMFQKMQATCSRLSMPYGVQLEPWKNGNGHATQEDKPILLSNKVTRVTDISDSTDT